MRLAIVSLALIAETVLVVATAYVFYRWSVANAGPQTPFSDLIPYWGAFARVVAPWIAACVVIPACALVLTVARRFRRT